jgi:hypothetical protein
LIESGTLPCDDAFAWHEFHKRYPQYRDHPLRSVEFRREAFEFWAAQLFGPTWPPELTEAFLPRARSLGARIPENGFRVHYPVGPQARRRFERRHRHANKPVGSALSHFQGVHL